MGERRSWRVAADCKSVALRLSWFESILTHQYAGRQDKGRPAAFQAEDRGVRLSLPAPDIWGISSAGRAPALQAGGQRFDPVILHQIPLPFSLKWRLINDRDPVAEDR